MKKEATNPMDAIAALMSEREKYEAWIAALEGRRAETPPHVYQRVHADYESRLREVLDQLSGRSDELKQSADTLGARVARLESEEHSRRDERAEAELRAMVGEFEPRRWDELRESSDREIGRLAEERQQVAAELARTEQVLSVATAQRRAQTPPSSPRAEATEQARTESPARADRSSGVTQPAIGAADVADQRAAAPPPTSFDELAFLKSVTEPPSRASDDRAVASRAKAPDVATTGSPKIVRQASMTPAATATRRTPLANTPLASAPVAAAAPPEETRAPASPAAEPAKRSVSTTDAVPAFLKDVPSEQVKTLKCQECGTMNYPTEWYCERCGGELAAM